MHQILSQKVNVAIANDKEAWHFCWASLCINRHLPTSLTVSRQPSIATHGRDYEDCKQFLKLSLNLTHTLERPERQWPLPLARQSPQTFPMGRAESEDAAYGADILRKLRMTSPTASSSDKIKNGSTASEKAESISRLHLPLSAHLKK